MYFQNMPVRVWGKSDDGRFKFETLSAKYLSQVIDCYRKSFYVNESISIVTQIATTEKGCQQFDELLIEIAQDGASVVGIEVATDRVVGAAINKLEVSQLPSYVVLSILILHYNMYYFAL